MTEKERLLKVLRGERVDRPPVICPGGMMNAAVSEVVQDIKNNHNSDLDAMVEAAKKVHQLTGFENYGVPFCMTVECEPLGVEVDLGDKLVEPLVTKYKQAPMEAIMQMKVDPCQTMRMPVVLAAIKQLKNDEIPVIGNITGPISTASSVIDPLDFFKAVLKSPDITTEFLDYITDELIEYAREMIKAGADVIAMSDPSATGEILGKKNFEKIAIPLYQRIIDAVHSLNVPIIIHICGNAKNIVESLNSLEVNALSFDAFVSVKYVKERIKTKVMGNVSTLLLHNGTEEKIAGATNGCLKAGVDIVSPACGLGMGTSIENLKVMTSFVKRGIY